MPPNMWPSVQIANLLPPTAQGPGLCLTGPMFQNSNSNSGAVHVLGKASQNGQGTTEIPASQQLASSLSPVVEQAMEAPEKSKP